MGWKREEPTSVTVSVGGLVSEVVNDFREGSRYPILFPPSGLSSECRAAWGRDGIWDGNIQPSWAMMTQPAGTSLLRCCSADRP